MWQAVSGTLSRAPEMPMKSALYEQAFSLRLTTPAWEIRTWLFGCGGDANPRRLFPPVPTCLAVAGRGGTLRRILAPEALVVVLVAGEHDIAAHEVERVIQLPHAADPAVVERPRRVERMVEVHQQALASGLARQVPVQERERGGVAAVRVESDQVPVADVVRVVVLARAEVRVVAGVGHVFLVVSGDGAGLALEWAPPGVVVAHVLPVRAVRIGQVAQGQHEVGLDQPDQARGVVLIQRRVRSADVARRGDERLVTAAGQGDREQRARRREAPSRWPMMAAGNSIPSTADTRVARV